MHLLNDKKHKILLILSIMVIAFLTLQGILLVSGWYKQEVEVKARAVNSIRKESNEQLEREYGEHAKVLDVFYNFDGLDMNYTITSAIDQGQVLLKIYTKKENGNWLYGQELPCIDEIELADGGVVELSNKDYEANQYLLFVVDYESDSAFRVSSDMTYRVLRWQRIHDRWLVKLPWIHEKYYPEYDSFWNEW